MAGLVLAMATTMHLIAANGQALRELPPLLRAISDEVGVISVSDGRALSRHIARVEDERGIKIIVVIAETVKPEDIDDYTRRLVAHWRAGSHALDSGRYVFIVLALKDRELRITPGARTVQMVEDVERSAALDALPPLLRQGRYFEALDAIVKQLERLATPGPVSGAPRPTQWRATPRTPAASPHARTKDQVRRATPRQPRRATQSRCRTRRLLPRSRRNWR